MTVRCATTDPFVMLAPRVQNEATAPKEVAALTATFATIARFAMTVRRAMTALHAMIVGHSFAESARASIT
jgi:hypothetical protein